MHLCEKINHDQYLKIKSKLINLTLNHQFFLLVPPSEDIPTPPLALKRKEINFETETHAWMPITFLCHVLFSFLAPILLIEMHIDREGG